MKFIDTWHDSEMTLAELMPSLVTEFIGHVSYRYALFIFLMDTINGRNDIHIEGMTPAEIERMIARLEKSLM